MISTLCVLALVGTKPLMKDFIGLNVHTVMFKPDLYRPVTSLLRDYHGISWDLGDDSSASTRFPFAKNGVNWEDMYSGWRKQGYRIEDTLMFEEIKQDKWKDVERDGWNYGYQYARFFGPSTSDLVEAMEIGNEPGKLDDAFYRRLFKSVAEGVRKGDPKLKIATCATFDKPSGDYHKSLSCVKGLESLYDVVNLHSYPQLKEWPTWERSFPEDPRMPFLKEIQSVIDWRDKNALGKEVWLTEFGYDASTKKPDPKGESKDWIGVTDEQQAQWIVRAYLTLSAMDLNRAYLFWFNDDDTPSLHAAAGLTRKYVPKPSFWSVAYLQKALGERRFSRVVSQTPRVYEYVGASTVWVVWSPTGSGVSTKAVLSPASSVVTAERMPLKEGNAEKVPFKVLKGGRVEIEATETPVFLTLAK